MVMVQFMQVKVSNYWEAIGVIAAHKAGVDPYCLRKNGVKRIKANASLPYNSYALSSIQFLH